MGAAGQKNTYTAAEVAQMQATIQSLQAENEALKQKLVHMNEVFANAQRARFGQSSEKAAYVMPEDQISLFNEAESCQNPKEKEPTEETLTVAAHTRKKKKTVDEKTKDIPVEEVLLELPESQRSCSKCGGTFRPIGKKFVRRELLVIPRQVKILEYYTVTYACDRCEKDTGYAHQAVKKPIQTPLFLLLYQKQGRLDRFFDSLKPEREAPALRYYLVGRRK